MAGEVQHFEIPYDKADRAKKFYSTVFGWKMKDMHEMKYTWVSTGPVDKQGMPTKMGVISGGMMKRMDWFKAPSVTVTVDDIDKTLQKVKKTGGKAIIEKQKVGEMGWSAYVQDSEGNVIGLWQSSGKGPM